MRVRTDTPTLRAMREQVLRLLANNFPADALARFPEKPFQAALRKSGLDGGAAVTPAAQRFDGSHPYLAFDPSLCIECFRCVRICDELQGQFVWRIYGRGEATRVLPSPGGRLRASACVACGACVDTCPTGSLEDWSRLRFGAATEWTRTVCPYCGVGCELRVGTRDGRIVGSRPVLDAPVNKGHLCSKGRYAFDFVAAEDRVTTPLLRESGRWREASWEEALEFVAARLQQLLSRHGPSAVGVLGSARATNEDNYLVQKFARVALGTNNVDCCARVCHAPSAAALGEMLGAGAATNSFDDVESARAVLVVGSNTTEAHPVVGARIKQAALRGVPLIVIDPRRIELADYARRALRPRPGTNVPLFNAMACVVVEEGLVDDEFVAARVSGWDDFRSFIRGWTPERAQSICGVPADDIRAAARLYAEARPALCVYGLGVTEQEQGTDGVMCLVNLALLTGNLGRTGAGVVPLRGQNNVQGAAQMGCEPDRLTGSVPIASAASRFAQVWGCPVPRQRGLDLMEMMDAAAAGRLHALHAVGYDVLLTNPDGERTRRALGALDLLVVQDLFLNETAREAATVFLPACSSFEKDGTFMNGERRIQRVRRVLPRRGESLADWEIICRLAGALGAGAHFGFRSPEEVWDEVRRLWPAGAGISYRRLEQGGLQWPCPSEGHPGTRVLHATQFSGGPRAGLRRVEYRAAAEETCEAYPLVLVTGRALYAFNAGTMTGRTPSRELRRSDALEMAPEDAQRLHLADDELVRVRSRHGEAILPVQISSRVAVGELFATFHTPSVFLNRVTGAGLDPRTHTPAFKRTPVRVERASGTPQQPTQPSRG